MVELNLFHYSDRGTFLHRVNPITKIGALLLFSLLISIISFTGFVLFLLSFLVLLWVIALPILQYRREFRFFLMMGTIIGCVRALQGNGWEDPFSAVVRFASIICMGIIFADTSAPDDISRAVGHTLSYIPRVHGNRIGTTIELTISTIPLLFDISMEVYVSRKARGEQAWKHPVRYIVSYTSTIFEHMLDRAQILERALTARYFNPDADRGHFGYTWRDLIVVMVSIACTAIHWWWL